jgi:hypothetical protein
LLGTIKNQEFWDNNYKYWFPTGISGSVEDKMKLLGLKVETTGNICIALASKCYYVKNESKLFERIKVKGVNQDQLKNIS